MQYVLVLFFIIMVLLLLFFPLFQSHYEDPDKVLLPSSLADPSIVIWKRPNDPLISDVLDKLVSYSVRPDFLYAFNIIAT